MTTSKDEYLSALVDDELGAFEQRRLLDELTSDAETAARWGRYHLIGEALRGGLPARTNKDFVAHVRASIADQEPHHVDPASLVHGSSSRPVSPGKARSMLGLALAASVAAVTVLGVQALLGDREGAQPQLAEAPGQATLVATEQGQATVASAEETAPQAGPWMTEGDDAVRLNSYLVTHSEHSAVPGMLPQVRVVGYAREQE